MTRNNVRIAIRDSTDSHNVAFFDNRAGIKYKSANLQRFLAGSASILTLKYNSKDIDSIRSGCKLAFRYKNRDYWLNVMNFEKKGFEVELTAYSLGLELNNEERGEYKPDNAMSIAEYVAYYDPEHALTIGVNEVADKRIKLEWTGTDTILARLFSVANSFDAELDFSVELNDDYSLKRQVLNIYKKGNLGTNKLSQPVRVGKELKVINYSDNIKELRTAVRATGKDGLTIDGLNKKIYDDNKQLLYYSSANTVYAPQSRDRFPSVGKGSNDNWIIKDLGETQYETKEALWGYMYSEIQKISVPEITYEVEGAIDAGIGDTQTLIDDKHFEPALYVQARVSELEDDILTGKVTKSTFINFERKYSQIADELQKRVNELVEASIPYTIKISSDNGTVFKNATGTSTFKARVFKGEKEITSDVTWRWALDGNVTVGMQYLVKASAIKDTAVLTASAYIGNNEAATTEITLTNVNDGAKGDKGDDGDTGPQGPQGPKGDRGDDGLPGKDGVGLKSTVVTYGLSTSETTQPTSWTAQVPALVKGQYLWSKTVWTYTDNTSETGYQKTYIPKNGNDGNDGIPGKDGVGIKTTTITYASSTSGTTAPTSGWSSTIPSVSAGNYLWAKTVWTYTDNTSETGYSVAKMGETGATGNGIANTVITYGLSTSETTEPATWASNMPVLVKGMYLWTRTIQIYTNGKSTTSYQKGYIAKDGNDGLPGTPGADGKTQYTHIAYADNATGGGFSQTDQTKAYIGMYQDFNATDSADPTKYKWSKWKGSDGAQGIPGKAGADGKTPYIHFAYADDNKGTNLSFTDKNQQYQGYYSDYTEANSTDYKKYTWVDRLANVQIDQLNLIGAFNLTPQNATFDRTDYTLTSTTTTNTKDGFVQLQFFDTKNVVFTGFNLSEKVGKFAKSFKITKAYEHFRIKINGNASDAILWCYDKDLLKLNTDYVLSGEVLSLSADGRGNGGKVRHLKIQEGKVATGFSKAPQDVDDDINSKADSALTQEQLNALEAKRLQMEVEMKALATLQQVSELETFINNLKKEDLDGRQKIIEITKAIEERVKDIEPIMEYSQKLQFMDTYITQGNGGMIIGANDSTTKVVVTPDRISFQSGGLEVAYISQRMLHIDNGVFTMSLQLGHYITRAHPKNEYVNATYFVK
nr:MAG TPA: tail protein [Caudoviricetes sp.]